MNWGVVMVVVVVVVVVVGTDVGFGSLDGMRRDGYFIWYLSCPQFSLQAHHCHQYINYGLITLQTYYNQEAFHSNIKNSSYKRGSNHHRLRKVSNPNPHPTPTPKARSHPVRVPSLAQFQKFPKPQNKSNTPINTPIPSPSQNTQSCHQTDAHDPLPPIFWQALVSGISTEVQPKRVPNSPGYGINPSPQDNVNVPNGNGQSSLCTSTSVLPPLSSSSSPSTSSSSSYASYSS